MSAPLLRRLAARYGTPLYVYDLDEARAAHAELARSVPAGSHLFYSLKANPFPPLVRGLLDAGARAEVCSRGELDTALAEGAAPGSCLYTGPGKTEDELGHAIARGVRLFSVDSPTDLARLGLCARRAGTPVKAILRLNPADYPRGAGLAMGGAPSQFGADVAWVRASPERFRADGVELVGYHVYVGTNIDDVDGLMGWFALALDAVRQAQEALRLRLETVDLGGGFGHPYARPGDRPAWPGLAERLASLLADLPRAAGPPSGRGDAPPVVAFESGRYLAGGCGTLVLGVQDVKRSKDERFVIADGGINVLGGMQGLRRVPPIMAGVLPLAEPGPDGAEAAADGAEADGAAVLAGPLCTALDLLNHRARLPGAAPGDLLAVPNVGAYGLTAALLAFLGRDAPAEVAVDAGGVRAALRLETAYRRVPERDEANAANEMNAANEVNRVNGADGASGPDGRATGERAEMR
ncbi:MULTISPECIES: type III PLP-dependent enzyme [Actinomadura]|uniref:Type III PLP-dependent enzyme n=1 Tax=Actinomadura yumaensis TaxID=111807 RepID=A0ABW2CYU9_9ACTN|nr:type III PLP-dependent enzyme [Actinomadura sp. J1-007]